MKTTIRKDLIKILTYHNISLRQIQAAELHWQDRKGYFPTEYQKKYDSSSSIFLYPGHTDSEFDKWLSKMELIEYSKGLATGNFECTIWIKGSIWIDSRECGENYYFWWEVHKRPPLPRETKSIKVTNPNQL